MPSKAIETLRNQKIPFEEIPHSTTFTAEQTAQAIHLSGKKLAKTVIVEIDGELAMCVLHASEHVSTARLRDLTAANNVRIVPEDEFVQRFPDCDRGALPPFGNLYGMRVYVSETVDRDESLVFNPGSYQEVVQMPYSQYKQLVHPTVLDFAV